MSGTFRENPLIASELHPSRNNDLTHYGKKIEVLDLPIGTGKRLWWLCRDCQHEWQVRGADRVNKGGTGCPECSIKKRSLAQSIAPTGESFAQTHPHLLSDWDYSKNEREPNTFLPKSNITVSWICHDCNYSWDTSIAKRTRGTGCPKCAGRPQYNTESWVEKAVTIHSSKYDYSKVEYLNAKTKVEIICPIHGSFLQTPDSHLRGKGCVLCNSENRVTIRIKPTEWVERWTSVHGNSYDYSKIPILFSGNDAIEVICPTHGSFYPTADNHYRLGTKCPECAGNRMITREKWIIESIKTHGKKYDYTGVKIDGAVGLARQKVEILCSTHGLFIQNARTHMDVSGCPSCAPTGFDPSSPGYYYCMAISGPSDIWWFKGGITSDIQTRIKRIKKSLSDITMPLDIELVDSIWFEDGWVAQELETRLLRETSIRAKTLETFDGSSELFTMNPLEYARNKNWIE